MIANDAVRAGLSALVSRQSEQKASAKNESNARVQRSEVKPNDVP